MRETNIVLPGVHFRGNSPMPPASDLPTDEDLCLQHLAGDERAFRLLVERYSTPLYRHAFRFTNDQHDAEDIAQETFIRLDRTLPRLDLSRPIRPWLYRVCTNLCRNLAEKKKSILFSDLERNDADESADRLTDNFPSSDDGPDLALAREDDIRIVRESLKTLPEKYRTVLALYYFDGLSYEEIAEALALPINTIRTHLRRAKDTLKTAIERHYPSLP